MVMVIAKIVRGLFYLNLRFETVENAQKKSWNAGNSFTVFADEMDVQVQQETTGNEEEIFVAEEAGSL